MLRSDQAGNYSMIRNECLLGHGQSGSPTDLVEEPDKVKTSKLTNVEVIFAWFLFEDPSKAKTDKLLFGN